MMPDPLDLAEAEMAVAEAEAVGRWRVAQARMQSVDRELGAQRKVVWGDVVDRWHDAFDEAADSAEAVAAYEAFAR